MTDRKFDLMFKAMTAEQKLKWLGENLRSVQVKNGQGYVIDSEGDLLAAVEQELYEKLTGRK